MKIFIWIILILFCRTITAAQTELIDAENPIYRFEVNYSPDNRLIFNLVLSSNVNSKSLEELPSLDFKATAEGHIEWNDEVKDENKKKFKAIFNQSRSSLLNFNADIKDFMESALYSPPISNWKRLNDVKVKFTINNRDYQLPFMTIYPPVITIQNPVRPVITVTKAKKIDLQSCIVSLSINPEGTPFEVNEIKISKDLQTISFDKSKLGDKRYANDGRIDIPITTNFDLKTNGPYTIYVKARKIGEPELIIESENSIHFIDESIRKIVDVKPASPLIIDDVSSLILDVRTEGLEGTLGIKFTSPEYTSKIQVKIVSLASGDYDLTLSNLNTLTENSSSAYYFTINGIEQGEYGTIEKKGPEVSNFKFIGTSDKKLQFEFKMPSSMKSELISIGIKGEKNIDLVLSNNEIIRNDEIDKRKIKIELPIEITRIVTSDTLVKINLTINYKNKSVYDIGFELFNQKILNEKYAELVAETSKKGKKDKERIKSVVQDIVNIGIAIGNSINQSEVSNAIDQLSKGNKESIKKTMVEVGKWAALAGKIIIPLLI